MTLRLPDFLIIGAMKSGTTSLFRWLGEHPGFALATVKEPDFFSHDRVWARGLDWYAELFAHAPNDVLTGEASTSYTGLTSDVAAERIARTVPDAKLVYVVRDPAQRLRSHYRHEAQRGREKRPFTDAASNIESPYVARSLYWQRFAPYVDAFPAAQLCVVRFEDLVSDDSPGWKRVLDHLGATFHPRSDEQHNVTADKPQYTRLLLRQWERNRLAWVKPLPKPARRLGKRVMTRSGRRYRAQLEESAEAQIPERIAAALDEDAARLSSWCGATRPLWP